MRTNSTHAIAKSVFASIVVLFIASSISVQAQPPKFRFKNPTLVSGTAGQLNAVYRFPNVNTTGAPADALVKIQGKVGNITLVDIDRTADGYNEAFQPEYSIGANSNGYFEFLITFVVTGTNIPLTQSSVEVSALDIDGLDTLGYKLTEFNRVDMGGGLCNYDLLGGQLSISQSGTAFDGINVTGVLFGALVDTLAKSVMYSVTNTNVTSFIYRAGANNLFPIAMDRYASLYFKKFTYPNNVILSIRNLASFSGVAGENETELKWTLTEGNDASTIQLEKSVTGTSFQTVMEFRANVDDNSKQEFSYTDNKISKGSVYYRLKVTNKEGRYEYSNILHFSSDKNEMNQLAIYPSLVQSAAMVNYTSNERQSGVIMVMDMNGSLVKKQNVLLQQGINSIQVSGFDHYAKGSYIVSLLTAGGKSAKQILVQ